MLRTKGGRERIEQCRRGEVAAIVASPVRLIIATFKSADDGAAERNGQQQQQDNVVVVMGKQNGEDLDQDAQERMLKEDNNAKIAIEKEEKDEKATEVRISSWTPAPSASTPRS